MYLFIFYVLLQSAASMNTRKNSNKIVDMHLCEHKVFLVERIGMDTELIRYLDYAMDFNDEYTYVPDEPLCNIAFTWTGGDLLGEEFRNFTIQWMGELDESINVYLYAQSIDQYNLYKLSSDVTETVDSRHEGCIISMQHDGGDDSISFNYTDISLVRKRIGDTGLNISEYDTTICQEYINWMKNSSHTYSPFHGLPILYDFAPSFRIRVNESTKLRRLYGPLWLEYTRMFIHGLRALTTDWSEYLKLQVDANSSSTDNHRVSTRIAYWGHPLSVAAFDTLRFQPLTEKLESWGYMPGLSIRAAPYDFRLAPSDQSERFITDFKQLVEATYASNNNRRIVILGHSMGNLFTLYFLNRQTQAWKDKYIRSFISLAAPWYGSADALKFLLRGELDGELFSIKPIRTILKPIAKTWKSLLFLLPNEHLYSKGYPIVRTPSRNYTVMDYEKLFEDAGMHELVPAYHSVKDLIKDMVPPGVEVHCMYSYYGEKAATDHQFSFPTDSSFPNDDMKISYEDGDNTVHVNSAKACLQWIGRQGKPVFEKSFFKVDHSDFFTNDDFINYMKELLFHS